MQSLFLTEFFKKLDLECVDYLVLRGYQNLPITYGYDIDFSVREENELNKFFELLHSLSKKYDYTVSRDVVRLGLLKVFLHFENETLRIDVFSCFSYGGLDYMNIDNLHDSKRRSSANIAIPSLNYELALSLLKEILHNSRIRKDKKELLRRQYDKYTFNRPFAKYFSEGTILEISQALFATEEALVRNMSKLCRIDLLLNNIKTKGFLRVTANIIDYFFIKYIKKNKYDNVIYRH